MEEDLRALKRTRFGGRKYVYPKPIMDALRELFAREVPRRLPEGTRTLYLT